MVERKTVSTKRRGKEGSPAQKRALLTRQKGGGKKQHPREKKDCFRGRKK